LVYHWYAWDRSEELRGGGGLGGGGSFWDPPARISLGPFLQNSKDTIKFLSSRTVLAPSLVKLSKGGSVCMAGSQCHARKGVGGRGCKGEHAANQFKLPG
jgi:hypothetical protein